MKKRFSVYIFLAIIVLGAVVTTAGPEEKTYINPKAIKEWQKLGYDYPVTDFGSMPVAGRKVFPDAQGFGIYTTAGQEGSIIHVTNLNSEGPGSLREALNTLGPRVIVFDVGGIIDLQMEGLSIGIPNVTIAGQTAPSPGITIIRGGIHITTHDVLIQHIRVRPGDGGNLKFKGWETDCISTHGGEVYNVVIDHCSTSWATDEGVSASGPRPLGPLGTTHFVTFSNCIIAENLNNATHSKGTHSKGTLAHDNTQFIAYINNLIAHSVDRSPYLKAFTLNIVVNNLIYNPGSNAIRVDYVPSEWLDTGIKPLPARLVAVGNVMYHGVDTLKHLALIGTLGLVYMDDNIALKLDGTEARMTMGQITILKELPIWPEGYKAMKAKEVEKYIIEHCGARPKDRDSVDKRIIDDLKNRKGKIIDSQDQVGGYPKAEMTTRVVVVPQGVEIHVWLGKLADELE